MPRELITIQIGQCGNQLGLGFWERAIKEHSALHKRGGPENPYGLYDDPLSGFFQNMDTRLEPPMPLPVGSPLSSLRARCVLVDMEDTVTNRVLRGDLKDLFAPSQVVSSRGGCGSGNNWAQGFVEHGDSHIPDLLEAVRREAEACDSLQSFFLVHSLGGGTGSGLGTRAVSALEDAYPEVYRFVAPVFPSAGDDVVTSPYNCVLGLGQLTEHADAVLPVDNESLAAIASRIQGDQEASGSSKRGQGADATRSEKANTFAAMNDVAATMLCDLTSSMRFDGSLNVDLNEITMNLVPFPRLHYLVPSISPVIGAKGAKYYAGGGASSGSSRGSSARALVAGALGREGQLIRVEPRGRTYLACALLFRGNLSLSDISDAIERAKPTVRMPRWNTDAFKVGLCGVRGWRAGGRGVGEDSVLCLANTCSIADKFDEIGGRFNRLLRARAHLHHYTEYMELDDISAAGESLRQLAGNYRRLEKGEPEEPEAPTDRRIRVL